MFAERLPRVSSVSIFRQLVACCLPQICSLYCVSSVGRVFYAGFDFIPWDLH